MFDARHSLKLFTCSVNSVDHSSSWADTYNNCLGRRRNCSTNINRFCVKFGRVTCEFCEHSVRLVWNAQFAYTFPSKPPIVPFLSSDSYYLAVILIPIHLLLFCVCMFQQQLSNKQIPTATKMSSTTDIVVCPYNPSHLVPYTRMPYHLMKCRRNYNGPPLDTCMYNATHLVAQGTLPQHYQNCPAFYNATRDRVERETGVKRF